MARHWLCTVNKDNWRIIRKELIWGASRRFKGRVEKISVGDKIVFYVTPASIGGIFEAITPMFEETRKIFASEEVFPCRIKLKPLIVPKEPISFRPLIPKLSFIRDKKRWSAYIRLPVREIPVNDYNVILWYLRREHSAHKT